MSLAFDYFEISIEKVETGEYQLNKENRKRKTQRSKYKVQDTHRTARASYQLIIYFETGMLNKDVKCKKCFLHNP